MVGRGHFALLVADFKAKSIQVYDSIKGMGTESGWMVDKVRLFLEEATDIVFAKKSVSFPNCRRQGNSVDCMVYTMLNMRLLLGGKSVLDARMPGVHMAKIEKDILVAKMRLQIAEELENDHLKRWE